MFHFSEDFRTFRLVLIFWSSEYVLSIWYIPNVAKTAEIQEIKYGNIVSFFLTISGKKL